MKILVIHGSMRRGNTYALTQEIANRLLAKPDVEITEFQVGELDLPFCRSCHACFISGQEHCPHYGIMQRIETALAGCDGVIVSGVAYMWELNAAMKNLLDHMAYQFHRPSLFGKKGMAVATAAGAGAPNVVNYLKLVLGQWGINGAQTLTQTAKEQGLVSEAKRAAKLDRAAERFYQTLKSSKIAEPSFKNMAVHNAFRAMSLGSFSGSERDTEYWQRDGFKDRAYPVRAGWLKYLFGAFVYGAVKLSLGMIDGKQEKSK